MIKIDDIKSFKSLLNDVARYTSTRSPIAAQSCVLLDSMDGKLEVSAYDGFRTCKRTVPCEGDLSVLVDAQKLCRVLGNIDQGIELSQDENNHLDIKAGRTKVKISGTNVAMATRPVEVDGNAVNVNAHELADLLSFGSPLSKIEKGGGEKAVQILPEYGVVISDSFIGNTGVKAIAHVKSDIFQGASESRACLQSAYVKPVVSSLKSLGTEDEAEVIFCESHVTFRFPGCEICIRRLENSTVGNVPVAYLNRDKAWTTKFTTTASLISNAVQDGDNLGIRQVQTEFGTSDHSIEVDGEFNGDDLFLNMDTFSIGLECFDRNSPVLFQYNENAISISLNGKEVLIAGTEDM
jgi:hypothetical protein